MNKAKISIIILITIIILINAAVAQAKKADIDSDISIDTSYNYVWRGQLIDSGMVLQPSIGSIIEGITAKMWQNYSISSAKVTRNELRLGYVTQSDNLKFGFGTIYYARGTMNDTMEGYITVGEFSQLNTSLTLYYDFLLGKGQYLATTYQHTFGEDTKLNLKMSININIGDKVMGLDSAGAAFTGLYNFEGSFYWDLPISNSTSFRPNGMISFPLGPSASTAIASLSSGGTNMNYSFGLLLTFRYK
jgi:hypothetical protein